MKFTDSHCHLDFPEFNADLSELLKQCAHQNIHQIIIPSINPDNWQKVLELSSKLTTTRLTHTSSAQHQPRLYACLGIHPWFLDSLDDSHLKQLSQISHLHQQKLIAIGEAGIDMPIAKQQNNLVKQKQFFLYQLTLAKNLNKPIIVHHRQSHHEIIPILKQAHLNRAGIIHAFSGSYQQAKSYIDLGFKLGIGGTITYPRAKKTINAIKRLPLSSLVLETDAPAMPLFGYQGQRNSPLRLSTVFEHLVELRSESIEEIAEQIELNITELFGF